MEDEPSISFCKEIEKKYDRTRSERQVYVIQDYDFVLHKAKKTGIFASRMRKRNLFDLHGKIITGSLESNLRWLQMMHYSQRSPKSQNYGGHCK